jgi:hypothetical protein
MEARNTQPEPSGLRISSPSAALRIRWKAYRAAVIALFFAGAILLGTRAASADTITVINNNDSGPGSLRQALIDANDGDTINFDSSLNGQKITLTSGQLNLNKDVTISGPGANNLTVDGNAQSRVFYVNQTVTLSGLTIRNGGIYNDDATLTITNCTLDGNSADYGGGILNSGGFGDGAALTVSNCTISGNYGGGIYNQAFGVDSAPARATLTITDSILSGNYGGGISNSAFDGVAGGRDHQLHYQWQLWHRYLQWVGGPKRRRVLHCDRKQ